MRQQALHAAAGATASAHRYHDSERSTPGPAKAQTPGTADLPPAPTPDRGLVPSGTVSTTVADAPLSAVHSQRFASIPLDHAISVESTETGVELTATLTNTSDEPWAYRVPRGPAPLAGSRFAESSGGLRITATEGDDLFSDGVLRPGEAVQSTLAVSPARSADGQWPSGEHSLLQPLTVWTEAATYGYNWSVVLES